MDSPAGSIDVLEMAECRPPAPGESVTAESSVALTGVRLTEDPYLGLRSQLIGAIKNTRTVTAKKRRHQTQVRMSNSISFPSRIIV